MLCQRSKPEVRGAASQPHPPRESQGSFRSVQRAAYTSYSRPETSSKENNLTNATNGAVGNTGFSHSPTRSINKKVLPLEARIVPRPIGSIRVIRSLMTRGCAPRGRVHGRAIPNGRGSFRSGQRAACTSYSHPDPSSKQTNLTNAHEWGSGQYKLLLTVRPDRSTKNQLLRP